MTETSRPWGGTTVGDAAGAPYDDSEFSNTLRELITTDRTVEGVVVTSLAGYGSGTGIGGLWVTNPSGTDLSVDQGVGFVDGKMYYNSGIVTFPTAGDGYYRVVLRKNFVAQTVRLALLGPSGSIPALTQTDGVTWEVPISLITKTGGAIGTITDQRTFVNRTRAGMYEPGSIRNGDYGPDSIFDDAIGWRVPKMPYRQGAVSGSWWIPGSTNHLLTNVLYEAGVTSITLTLVGGVVSGFSNVVFHSAFGGGPIVTATLAQLTSGVSYPYPTLYISSISGSGFSVAARNDSIVAPVTWAVSWIAIGDG